MTMSTLQNPSSDNRVRRALTHGGGLDGLLFSLLSLVGVALLIGLLVFSFQSAGQRAERDTQSETAPRRTTQSELGDNTP